MTGPAKRSRASILDADVEIERKFEHLPVFAIVPSEAAASLGKTGTFVVEAEVNGQPIGRRSIKPWGDGRWFLELTKTQSQRLQVGPGDRVRLDLFEAPEVPAELEARLKREGLWQAWLAWTPAQRRSLCEPIFAAQREATRNGRIERVIKALRAKT